MVKTVRMILNDHSHYYSIRQTRMVGYGGGGADLPQQFYYIKKQKKKNKIKKEMSDDL